MLHLYALEGIKMVSQNLLSCVEGARPGQKGVTSLYDRAPVIKGRDPFLTANDAYMEARTRVALGSMYGGMCLGPVNTGAVHALAYPLGGEFHVAHGVSNAVLLPHVLEFNLPAASKRYAEIAVALGVHHRGDDLDTARRGLEAIRELCRRCKIPPRMRDLGVP